MKHETISDQLDYPTQTLCGAYEDVAQMQSALSHMIERTFEGDDAILPDDFGRGLYLLMQVIAVRYIEGLGDIVKALEDGRLKLESADPSIHTNQAENLDNMSRFSGSNVQFVTKA